MKKKIKDLTLLEANKICLKPKKKGCEECPLCLDTPYCLLDTLEGDYFTDKYRDQIEREVEVDE